MTATITAAMLHETLKGVLEDAAFIMTEPAPAGACPDGTVVEASMVLGEGLGELHVRAEEMFATVLAANLLGEEPGSAAATSGAGDAMGELLNMVAGGVVVAAGGKTLGLPRVQRVPSAQSNGAWDKAPCRSALLTDEGQRVELAVFPSGGAR